MPLAKSLILGATRRRSSDLFSYRPGQSLAGIATFSRNRMADYTTAAAQTAQASVNQPRDAHYVDGVRTLRLTD